MGNAAIIIRSIGPHENNLSFDAERIASRTVAELKSLGHDVLSASVETGGTSIVLVGPGASSLPAVKDPDGPARAAYQRYLHASGGRSLISGAELPDYAELPEEVRAAWRAVADPGAPQLVR